MTITICLQLRTTRATVSNLNLRWPNGIVPYTFHETLGSVDIDATHRAMDLIENTTCIRFVPRTNEADYVVYKTGCTSRVGKKPRGGAQDVNLSLGCATVHEILHALGMWHEHTRPDRDEYVRVIPENIKEA